MTLDFTFSIPMKLPAAPLEATSYDQEMARANKVARLAQREVTVEVSPSARVRAGGLPLFDDESLSAGADNEQRLSSTEDAATTSTQAETRPALFSSTARASAGDAGGDPFAQQMLLRR